jgi:hypothetical protein
MRYPLLLLSVLGVFSAMAPARAEPPPGIVMAITGETDPPLSAMAEIPANTLIVLQATTKLTFLHYSRCKLVTVIGGTLTLTRADYKEDGRVESEADGPCPHVYALPDTGAEGRSTGGIVARALDMPPHWPASPDIIFTGARARVIAAAAIFAEGQLAQPALQLNVVNARGRPGQGGAPLQPGGHYMLRLTMADKRDTVDVPFIAVAPTSPGSLVVLRVD